MSGEPEALEKRYRRNPAFVFRQIAEECLLIPIAKTLSDVNSLYVLNEVGSRIWELLDGERSVQQVRQQLHEEFTGEAEVIERDLHRFLEELRVIGAIEASDG